MTLTEQERADTHAELMSELSRRREPTGAFTKADLRAAIDAIDDWVEANQTAFNAALPEPARSEMTSSQKAEALARVVRKRFDVQ